MYDPRCTGQDAALTAMFRRYITTPPQPPSNKQPRDERRSRDMGVEANDNPAVANAKQKRISKEKERTSHEHGPPPSAESFSKFPTAMVDVCGSGGGGGDDLGHSSPRRGSGLRENGSAPRYSGPGQQGTGARGGNRMAVPQPDMRRVSLVACCMFRLFRLFCMLSFVYYTRALHTWYLLVRHGYASHAPNS